MIIQTGELFGVRLRVRNTLRHHFECKGGQVLELKLVYCVGPGLVPGVPSERSIARESMYVVTGPCGSGCIVWKFATWIGEWRRNVS